MTSYLSLGVVSIRENLGQVSSLRFCPGRVLQEKLAGGVQSAYSHNNLFMTKICDFLSAIIFMS